MSVKRERKSPSYSTKTIWGAASSPELSLSKEELYAIIYRETGKERMTALTQEEIDKVCRVLFGLRDSAAKGIRRTDEGGNPKTVKMRRKIYMLTGELGWNDDNSRINAFCKKMYGVDSIQWLSISQCSGVIEGLKKIIARGGKEEDEEEKADAGGN